MVFIFLNFFGFQEYLVIWLIWILGNKTLTAKISNRGIDIMNFGTVYRRHYDFSYF